MTNTDKYGRKIDYLRISVTDKCNLRCSYCMPEEGVCHKDHNQVLRIEEILQIVQVAAKEGVKKIRLTGGEPLVRRGILSLIEGIAQIPGIREITMTTNGTLLKTMAHELKAAGLNRVNISLDTLNPETFYKITRGGILEETLEGIDAAIEAGLGPIKINAVLIGSVNDSEIEDFLSFAADKGIEWRLIELMPIGQVSDWSSDHFIRGKDLLKTIDGLERIEDTAYRRVKMYCHHPTGARLGLIDAISGKFCDSCNRLRLTADGMIKPCLHSDREYDVHPYLNNVDQLTEFYRSCVYNKPKEHTMDTDAHQPILRNMNRIGG